MGVCSYVCVCVCAAGGGTGSTTALLLSGVCDMRMACQHDYNSRWQALTALSKPSWLPG